MTTDPTSLEWFLKLREHRLAGIFREIQEWGNRPIEFSQDPRGTNLYSIEETKRAYCRRFIQLAIASDALLEDEKTIAACIVARAQIETVAMAAYFVHEVSRLIQAGVIEDFNAKVARFISGSSLAGSKQKPIHVNDALRHLQELDEEYLRYLWSQHPTLKKLSSEVLSNQDKPVEVEDVMAVISVTRNYDFLCEVTHPNSLGTFFMFGQPENETIAQRQVHSLLTNLTKSATWQGHHMLRELNATVDQSDNYFDRFESGLTPD